VRIWLPVNEHPDICENEAFSLLGSNGAGKTTIFHMLATLLKPISGIAFVNGYRIVKEQAKIRANIGMYSRLQALMICSGI
jgi:ABC-2 type transport system ATP-binding protein